MINVIVKRTFVLYELLVTLVGVCFFLASGLSVSLFSVCFSAFLQPAQAHVLGRYGMHYATKALFYGLGLSGLVKTDFKAVDELRDDYGIIITPNHPCLMDALFLSSRLPNVVCVMKASIISNPLLYGFAKLGGFISSDSPARFIQQCEQALAKGAQLVLFPEGTRTVTETVNPFKGGFSLIAKRTGAPVQAIFIEANTNFLGKFWPIWKIPPFPLNYRISPGHRFKLAKDADHKAFTQQLESYFKEQLTLI